MVVDAQGMEPCIAIQNVSPSESPSPDRKRQKSGSPYAGRVSQSPPSGANYAAGEEDKRDTGSARKKTKCSKQQDKEDMAWICAECKEADCGLVIKQQTVTDSNQGDATNSSTAPPEDSFLICDGACHRIFHVPCAGLARVPDADDDWLCKDCTRKEHACAFCAEYGRDNIDVFPCQDDVCGLFFHESCLQTHHVEYDYAPNDKKTRDAADQIVEDEDDLDEEEARIPVFTCPAHQCWTCTQKDMIQLEKEEEAAEKSQNGNNANKKNKRKKKKQSIFQSKPGRLFVSCELG